MRRSQKLFRYLWRISAILILLAAGAITFGSGALLIGELWRETNGIVKQTGDSCRGRRRLERPPIAWACVGRCRNERDAGRPLPQSWRSGIQSGGYTETQEHPLH